MEVYYCPDSSYTKYVFLSELFTQRGNDAEDIEEDEVPDFSDDEEEMRYYEMKKKTTETINSENSTVPNKQARNSTFGFKTNHPWNRNTKKNFQRRKSQVRYNDSQSPSNSYNPSQRPPCANFNYFNDQFYGYMPYSNNLQTNDTNNTSIPPNPRLPFGMFPRFQFNSSSTSYNGHNPFSPSRMRFPRANLHFQSQQAPYATSMRLPFATPSPYLFPPSYPPPPPPSAPFSSSIEQNHDTSQ
ncbi:PREDICTED: H/ACA ribonucleoprotein complex non-core subunit NAF1-like [Polistes dominula]|uniref:H/ACA ribonucleoprotein complex non-core subunit NAF1-like n=1 Tax=Polistes dominula TaxID=743375 RepID=A0ABM1I3Y7_POLDO|nr:PREDICTED: H/ACA ribonucleoprotein complex non-core subunit NAF1-like [Polistes dominula]